MLIAFLFLIYLKCHCPSIINYWLIDQTSSSLRSTMACSVQVRAVPQRGGGAGWDGLRRLRLDQPRLRPLRRKHHLRARRRRHALLHLQHPAPLPQRHHARQGHHRPLLRLGRRRGGGGGRRPFPGAAPLTSRRRAAAQVELGVVPGGRPELLRGVRAAALAAAAGDGRGRAGLGCSGGHGRLNDIKRN